MFNELWTDERRGGVKRNVYMGLIWVYMDGALKVLRLALGLHELTSGLYGALAGLG